MRGVIVGGGIHGAMVAMELATRHVAVTVVEACEVACAASGKAGGFLAKHFCDGSSMEELAVKGFLLHADLADGLDIGYRPVKTLSIEMASPRTSAAAPDMALPVVPNEDAEWLAPPEALASVECIGQPQTTAQVTPLLLTKAMMQTAVDKGAELRQNCRVIGLHRPNRSESVCGVALEDGEVIQADFVVLTMGPWSVCACEWLPQLPRIGHVRAHSIVVSPPVPIPATALFVDGVGASCEVYPRPALASAPSQVYVCGQSDHEPLPDSASDVRPDDNAIAELHRRLAKVSPNVLANISADQRQACHLPCSPDNVPLIGAVPGTDNTVFISTGHGCWGILMAPSSARALAELIVHGRSTSVDISAFDPARFTQRGSARHAKRR